MTRVLVVDDERLARNELRRMLAAQPQIQVVGEAASVAEGLLQIAALRPDLVLLNVQMPDGSGYDLLAALDEPPPEVIFTTGHGPCPADSHPQPASILPREPAPYRQPGRRAPYRPNRRRRPGAERGRHAGGSGVHRSSRSLTIHHVSGSVPAGAPIKCVSQGGNTK